jgi:Ser/Thr protein kinase RdoA (MazF antagonist)
MKGMPLSRWMDGERGLEELGMTLLDVAGRSGRLLSALKLKTGVYRISIVTGGQPLTVVAKRLTPPVAHRNRLALERWLPAAGLAHIAPRLIGVAAERAGRVVWHLYEDLGGASLVGSASTRPEVETAIELIANLHARFATNSVLVESRMWGEDHGIAFYDQNVRDAISAVRLARTASSARSRDCDTARTLLERLERLADERDYRARVLAEFGGPDTLLHGDLWLSNVALVNETRPQNGFGRPAPAIRLIDWDHVGPGSFAYDLSTLMLRFPAGERPRIVALYRAAAKASGIDVPADEYLQVLLTTAEYARIASDTPWRAALVARDGSQAAFEQLAEIDEWFARLQPRSHREYHPACDRKPGTVPPS